MSQFPTLRFKIISGGQTGTDRAALDWAIAHDVQHGGWCPQGRLAEDGVIDQRYNLTEMPDGKYRKRTRQNVVDSDATLILNLGELEGGSLQTQQFAIQLGRPCLVSQLENEMNAAQVELVRDWLRKHMPLVLNVAGPRESKRPGVYESALNFMAVLANL